MTSIEDFRKQRLDEQLRLAVGDLLFRDACFDGFHEYDFNREMLNAARSYQCDVLPNALLFAGPSGIGKTRLALAAARKEIERCAARVLFHNASFLLRRVRGAYPSDQAAMLDELRSSKILILDDLGTLCIQEKIEDILREIVDERWRRGRALIITTNVNDDVGLEKGLGKAVVSRLFDKRWTKKVIIK